MTLTVDPSSSGVTYQQKGGSLPLSRELNDSNQNLPTVWENLLDWSASAPLDVQLQLQVDYTTDPNPGAFFSTLSFPPRARCCSFFAGQNGFMGGGLTAWLGDTSGTGPDPESCVVVRIECGCGAERRQIFADARSGRFALGAQRYVRVDVCRWARPGLGDLLIQGSIGPSQSACEPLTYSCQRYFQPTGEEPVTISPAYLLIPPGAFWFDVVATVPQNGTVGNVTIYAQDVAFFSKSDTASIVYPPATPWPIPPGARYLTVNPPSGGTTGFLTGVTFWVR